MAGAFALGRMGGGELPSRTTSQLEGPAVEKVATKPPLVSPEVEGPHSRGLAEEGLSTVGVSAAADAQEPSVAAGPGEGETSGPAASEPVPVAGTTARAEPKKTPKPAVVKAAPPKPPAAKPAGTGSRDLLLSR